MATNSRSAAAFLRRCGLAETPMVQSPRLDTGQLKIHHYPLEASQLNPAYLLDAQGDPPPDRGTTDAWPPPQEVRDDGSSSTSSAGQQL